MNKLNKISKVILVIGIITTILGVVLGIVGFLSFGYSIVNIEEMESQLFNGFALFTLSPFITVGGVVISVAGGICLLVSHIDDITNFANKKVVPAVNQGVDYITPTVNRVSQSVSTGFNAAKEEFRKKD
jgi:amino acid transporter